MPALRALGLGIALCLAAEAALAMPTESVIYGQPPRRPPPNEGVERPAPGKPGADKERPTPGKPGSSDERPAPGKPGAGDERPAPGKPGAGDERPAPGKPGAGDERPAPGKPGTTSRAGPGSPARADPDPPGGSGAGTGGTPRPPVSPPPKRPSPKGSKSEGHGTLMPWGHPGKDRHIDGAPGTGSGAAGDPGGLSASGGPSMAQRYGDLSKAPGMGLIIGSVRVLGNKKTKTATILIAARVPLGKPLTAEMVQRIQRDVLSAGYVRSVDVNWEISKDRKDTLCLFLVVKEKISWFVAPYFSYTEGQYGGSIAFGDRNLLGTGKQLRFYLGYNTESQRVSIRYKDPNIFFTPWYWATMADYTRSVFKDYDPSKAAMRRGSLLRVQTFQRFTTELEAGYRWYHWVTTGIRYRFGLVDTERPHCLRASPLGERVFQRCPTSPADLDPALLGVSWYVGPEALLDDNGQWVDHTSHRAKFWKWRRDAGIVLLPELSRMHIIHGMEHGFSVAGHLSVNHRYLGGSFNYVTWKTEYDHALSFGRNPLFGARHNLRWHVEHGQNHNAPYFRDLRVGGTDLRGFISQQFSGDSLTRSTLEYKVHMFTVGWLMFRAVAFWDSAWVFFRKAGGKDALVQERDERRRFHLPYSPGPMDLRSWHNSLGTGLRIYIKGLSVGTVGVDVAYGIDVNKVRFVVTLGN